MALPPRVPRERWSSPPPGVFRTGLFGVRGGPNWWAGARLPRSPFPGALTGGPPKIFGGPLPPAKNLPGWGSGLFFPRGGFSPPGAKPPRVPPAWVWGRAPSGAHSSPAPPRLKTLWGRLSGPLSASLPFDRPGRGGPSPRGPSRGPVGGPRQKPPLPPPAFLPPLGGTKNLRAPGKKLPRSLWPGKKPGAFFPGSPGLRRRGASPRSSGGGEKALGSPPPFGRLGPPPPGFPLQMWRGAPAPPPNPRPRPPPPPLGPRFFGGAPPGGR